MKVSTKELQVLKPVRCSMCPECMGQGEIPVEWVWEVPRNVDDDEQVQFVLSEAVLANN